MKNNLVNDDVTKLHLDANEFYLDNVPYYCLTIKADDIVVDKFFACSHMEVIRNFFYRISANEKLVYDIHLGRVRNITIYYCDKKGDLQPLSMKYSYCSK